MTLWLRRAALAAALLHGSPEPARAGPPATPSTNDFGGIGLLQTRTARMAPGGTVEAGAAAVSPYRRAYLLAQPFDWLELTLRYSEIVNVGEGGETADPNAFSLLETIVAEGDRDTVLDRGFDLKVRIAEEGRYAPALALGFQDLFGRARFGGEYLVISKRIGPVDLSAGIGWGYLGSRSHAGSPLSVLADGFENRDADQGAGEFNFGDYFAGDIAFFGGLEWATPLDGLSVKLEYSGADPALEPFGNRLEEDSPINAGLTYRPRPWLDFAVGFERGEAVSARLGLRFGLFDPPDWFTRPEPTLARDPVTSPEHWNREPYETTLRRRLAGFGAELTSISVTMDEATLRLAGAPGALNRRALVDAAFAELPGRVVRLWAAFSAEAGPHDIRLYRPEETAPVRAAALAAMAAQQGEAAFIRLSARRAFIAAPAPDPDAIPAGRLAPLPDDIDLLLFTEGAGRTVRIVREKAAEAARAIVEALPGGRITALRMRGARMFEIAAADGDGDPDGLDVEALTRRAGVDHVIVAGAAITTAVQDRAAAIFTELKAHDITGHAIAFEEREATLWLAEAPNRKTAQAIGRAGAILEDRAPAHISRLTVAGLSGGAETYRIGLLRREIDQALRGRGSPEEIWVAAQLMPPRPAPPLNAGIENDAAVPRFDWGVAPVLRQHFGTGDAAAYRADLSVDLLGAAYVSPKMHIAAAIRRRIVGNLEALDGPVDPALPQVRSLIGRYSEEGGTAVAYAQADYVTGIARDLYARLSGGLFEPMFAGVGGELLYRPERSRFAVGTELNWVKQRDFDQLAGLRDYDAVVGDVSLYAEWGHDLRTVLRGGRYLAGDWGGTFEVSREFANGFRLGGFLTLTDGADDEFGGDNFDKGLFLRIPLYGLWPFGGPRDHEMLAFRSRLRDSGQRLRLRTRLYYDLAEQRLDEIRDHWPDLLGD